MNFIKEHNTLTDNNTVYTHREREEEREATHTYAQRDSTHNTHIHSIHIYTVHQ